MRCGIYFGRREIKMGVIVETARPYRCCNSCGSNDEVIEITALMRTGTIKQGTQIALCESCAEMLRYRLNSRSGRCREEYLKKKGE